MIPDVQIIGYLRTGEVDEAQTVLGLLCDAEYREVIGDVVFLDTEGWKTLTTEVSADYANPYDLVDDFTEWLEENDASHQLYRHVRDGLDAATKMVDLLRTYGPPYRLLWSTNAAPAYIVSTTESVTELAKLVDVLSIHERQIGDFVVSNRYNIEAWNDKDGKWESLGDSEVSLFKRFHL